MRRIWGLYSIATDLTFIWNSIWFECPKSTNTLIDCSRTENQTEWRDSALPSAVPTIISSDSTLLYWIFGILALIGLVFDILIVILYVIRYKYKKGLTSFWGSDFWSEDENNCQVFKKKLSNTRRGHMSSLYPLKSH